MGGGSRSNNGQRLTILFAEAFMRCPENEGWGLKDGARFEGLKQFIKGRQAVIRSRQGRMVHVVPYQEDLFVVVVGEEAAKDTKEGLL